jgi:diguanylate cyclase (GGDEF)-like protein/PAS domain S-box-containing protein
MPTRILIVEDESIVAQDIRLSLEELGYEVAAIADSGELALEQALKLKPNLILMDIRLLGEMDGIATTQQINQRINVPIVYLTALGDEETLSRVKATNPFGYVIKPFVERDLRIIIEISLNKFRIEQNLLENHEWLGMILHSVGDGVIATDTNLNITYLNPMAEQLTGWSFAEAVGKNITEILRIINEITRQNVTNPIVTALETREIVSLPEQTLLITKTGQAIPIGDSAASINDHRGTIPLKNSLDQCIGAVMIFRDITENKLFAERLQRQTLYDTLTQLPNRLWFIERLLDALTRIERYPNYLFAVIFLDLDRFKVTNDSLGHHIGDRLLVEVSNRLKELVSTLDTVARFSGDEFAILLENLDFPDIARMIAERINQNLLLPFYINGQEIYTSGSIGIAFSSINYKTPQELIRDAEIAMYRAKRKGRGYYEIFDPIMGEQIVSVSTLENDLRGVIERSELTLFYQPIISLMDQTFSGVEALVRWQHPQKGLILPDQFIPIAEETGFIETIDSWVLQEACQQMKRWLSSQVGNFFQKISVNISSHQCLQIGLPELVRQTLNESGLDNRYLSLEITETALIKDASSAVNILSQVKALGVSLCLDDFGTGYSCLSYLHRLPVDMIKIDRSFINCLNTPSNRAEIVKVIINLGQILNIGIVAEGIETKEQLELLKNFKCKYGQGYFFSRPLPDVDLQTLLLKGFP